MDDAERAARVAEIRAARTARGMADPLNRLIAHNERLIAAGQESITECTERTAAACREALAGMRVREHHGFGHGLRPGDDQDINCLSCKREREAGAEPVIHRG